MQPKLRVLQIDDSASDAWLLREALSQGGIDAQIETIQNGLEALASLRQYASQNLCPFDLVVMDLNLPGADGADLIELFSGGVLSRTPLAVMSSFAPAKVLGRIDRLPCAIYIEKPSDLSGLLAINDRLRDLVDRARRSPKSL